MINKKIKAKKVDEGFTLDQLFKEVDRVTKKAKQGDKDSKKILDSAYKKWEESSKYAY